MQEEDSKCSIKAAKTIQPKADSFSKAILIAIQTPSTGKDNNLKHQQLATTVIILLTIKSNKVKKNSKTPLTKTSPWKNSLPTIKTTTTSP